MKSEEIYDKIETMKTYLEELYDAGVIKPTEYNDIWAKINEIKANVKFDSEKSFWTNNTYDSLVQTYFNNGSVTTFLWSAMVIIERRCIECDHIRKMEHNAYRCYDCAMKRRKEMDHIRYQKRLKV